LKDINEYLDAKTVIIIVLAILTIILVVLCFRQWENISGILELMDTELMKHTYYEEEIIELRKIQGDTSEDDIEEEIRKRMPPTPDEAGLIATIDKLCKDTSGNLRDITFLSRNERTDYVEMPFTIRLTSDYYSLVDFLEGLAKTERFIHLTGLEMTVSEENLLLDVSISASTFSYTR
jgi:Tfp pilus assembly protein PilO